MPEKIRSSFPIARIDRSGVGSFNQGASVWVNQLETSFYRPGDRTTFGGPVPVELMRFTVE